MKKKRKEKKTRNFQTSRTKWLFLKKWMTDIANRMKWQKNQFCFVYFFEVFVVIEKKCAISFWKLYIHFPYKEKITVCASEILGLFKGSFYKTNNSLRCHKKLKPEKKIHKSVFHVIKSPSAVIEQTMANCSACDDIVHITSTDRLVWFAHIRCKPFVRSLTLQEIKLNLMLDIVRKRNTC